MISMTRLLIVIFCSLYWVSPAGAQTCGGAPSFMNAPYQFDLGLSFAEGTKTITGLVGIGADPFFVQAGVERQSFDDVDESAKGFVLQAGGDFALDSDKKIYACPVVNFAHLSGPNFPGVDISSNDIGFGGAVGFIAAKSGQLTVIPPAGLSIQHTSVSGETKVAGTSISVSNGDSFGIFDFGAGLLFNDRMALIPTIAVPFGLEGSETAFTIVFSINFGG